MYKSQTSAPSHTHQCTSAFPATPKEPISRSFKAWRKHSSTKQSRAQPPRRETFCTFAARNHSASPSAMHFSHGLYSLRSTHSLPFVFLFVTSPLQYSKNIAHFSHTSNCLYKAVFGLGDRSLKSRESLINNRCVSPFVAHHETLVPLQPSRTSSNHNPG